MHTIRTTANFMHLVFLGLQEEAFVGHYLLFTDDAMVHKFTRLWMLEGLNGLSNNLNSFVRMYCFIDHYIPAPEVPSQDQAFDILMFPHLSSCSMNAKSAVRILDKCPDLHSNISAEMGQPYQGMNRNGAWPNASSMSGYRLTTLTSLNWNCYLLFASSVRNQVTWLVSWHACCHPT